MGTTQRPLKWVLKGVGGKWLFLRGFYVHGFKVHHSSPSRAKFKNVYAYNSSPTGLHINHAFFTKCSRFHHANSRANFHFNLFFMLVPMRKPTAHRLHVMPYSPNTGNTIQPTSDILTACG